MHQKILSLFLNPEIIFITAVTTKMFTKRVHNYFLGAILLIFSITSCENKSGTTEEDEHTHDEAETEAPAKKPASPRKASMAMVDGNHVHVDYSSPSTRGRVIFGGLVAYDEVWVTGAHKATSITFDKSVKISGTEIKKGKYGLFTIPGEQVWTVIINKEWDMHLADDYDQTEDIIRIEVNPEILEETQESLEYKVETIGDSKGRISFAWDKMKVSIEFENL